MQSGPMPRQTRAVACNNTVKLTEALRQRVAKAMAVEGFTVWSEFCRVALTEKCVAIERNLRNRDPQEYARVYSREGT